MCVTILIILLPIESITIYRKLVSLRWRHNGRDGVSNHQPHDFLLNRLFRRRSKKHQSFVSLAFVAGIHRRPVNSPHKWPVTRKIFPFHDVIMFCINHCIRVSITFLCIIKNIVGIRLSEHFVIAFYGSSKRLYTRKFEFWLLNCICSRFMTTIGIYNVGTKVVVSSIVLKLLQRCNYISYQKE